MSIQVDKEYGGKKGVKSKDKKCPYPRLPFLYGISSTENPDHLKVSHCNLNDSGPLGSECDSPVTRFSSPELILTQGLEVKA